MMNIRSAAFINYNLSIYINVLVSGLIIVNKKYDLV